METARAVRFAPLFLLFFGAHSAMLPLSNFRTGKQLIVQAPQELKHVQLEKTPIVNNATNAVNSTLENSASSKIINPTTNSQIFLNYGLALTAAIYGLIGIGYFYGPYSVDAFLAKQRSEHRKDFLRQRLAEEDDEERDYGDYVEEELAIFQDYTAPERNSGNPAGNDYMYDYTDTSRGDPEYSKRLEAVTLDANGRLVHPPPRLARRRGLSRPPQRHLYNSDNIRHVQGISGAFSFDERQSSDQRLSELVNSVDMTHSSCQQWMRCLQQQRQPDVRQHRNILALPSVKNSQDSGRKTWHDNNQFAPLHASCSHYRRTCPAQTQKLANSAEPIMPATAPIDDVTQNYDVTTYRPR